MTTTTQQTIPLEKIAAARVLVVGDVNSTLACALTARRRPPSNSVSASCGPSDQKRFGSVNQCDAAKLS